MVKQLDLIDVPLFIRRTFVGFLKFALRKR